MPGPFPGMDPYLESPARWQGLHNKLIGLLDTVLNVSLPPGYMAVSEERMTVVETKRKISPDVSIVRNPVNSHPLRPSGGGAAVAEPITDEEPAIVMIEPETIREAFINIVSSQDESRVVTILEVLSYVSKEGGKGRQEYLRKQEQVLASQTHLLEIDLLRKGQHTVALPLDSLPDTNVWDYIVSLHRATRPNEYEYWLRSVRQTLPHRMRVPLDEDIPDTLIDLQSVFDQLYDAGPYRRGGVDYTKPPMIPLKPEDAEWADALLREKGLRP